MILPIIAYGDLVLKKEAAIITKEYPHLKELIANMYETMNHATGVGLAAPQIGLSIRLFVTDGAPFEKEEVKNFKQVFINPIIEKEEGKEWLFNEGCLSIPNIREDVSRLDTIHISYYDADFNEHKEIFTGIAARIIQHEYDHLGGILFTDRLSSLRKRLLKNKLLDISKGDIDIDYKMKFPLKK